MATPLHNSEIIEGSQVANISQELYSSRERIPSTDPHNQPTTSDRQTQNTYYPEIEQERPDKKQSIVLIGDSVIKDIIPEKMSARKFHKFCYPGKTANEISLEVQNIDIRESPSRVIIHAGTNNLPKEYGSVFYLFIYSPKLH